MTNCADRADRADQRRRRRRLVAGALAAEIVGSVVLAWAAGGSALMAVTDAPRATFGQLVVAVAGTGAWLALSRLTLGVLLLVTAPARSTRVGVLRSPPRTARLIVRAAVGPAAVGLSLTAAPASAQVLPPTIHAADIRHPAVPTLDRMARLDVRSVRSGAPSSTDGWVPHRPPRPARQSPAGTLCPAPRSRRSARAGGERGAAEVVVRRGDSLWAIAARHAEPGAGIDQIARTWPKWYAANRDLIGPDPNLLLPGQRLRRPDLSDLTGLTDVTGSRIPRREDRP